MAGPEEAFAPGKELDTLLRAASAKTRGQVVLVIAKLGTETAKPILDFFGLDAAASTAQVVGFDSKSNKKFKFPGEGEVTADALAAFAVALNDGSAQALLKSGAFGWWRGDGGGGRKGGEMDPWWGTGVERTAAGCGRGWRMRVTGQRMRPPARPMHGVPPPPLGPT